MSFVNWIEIPVLDLNRASKFYSGALNIRVQMGKIDNDTHAILSMEGDVGGILYEAKQIDHGIIVYFHVDRMSECLELVQELGGEVLQEKTLLKSYNTGEESKISGTMFDGKIGYFAKVKDTEGNILGLHSNA